MLLFSCGFIYLLGETRGTWDDWKPATCLPDGCFCEAPRNGTLLRQPVNTWSNMSFTAVGVLIVALVAHRLEFVEVAKRKEGRGEVGEPAARVDYDQYWFFALVFAMGLMFLGTTSGFYHASLTFVGQVLDNTGMYFIVCWGIAYNAHRFNPKEISRSVFLVLYAVQIVVFTLINVYLPNVRRYAFFASIVAFIVSQVVTDTVIKPEIQYRYFLVALGCIVVGFIFWILDNRKIVCDPMSWFQGHAVWHSLDALCAFFLYVFFASEGYRPSEYEPVKVSDLEGAQLEERDRGDDDEEEAIEEEEMVEQEVPTAPPMQQQAQPTMVAPRVVFAPAHAMTVPSAPPLLSAMPPHVPFGGPPPMRHHQQPAFATYNTIQTMPVEVPHYLVPPTHQQQQHYLQLVQQEAPHHHLSCAPLYPVVHSNQQ